MWRTLWVALLLTGGVWCGAGENDGDMPPPPPPPHGERFGAGPAMWRAFSELSEQEREELIALQRTDQEAFRKRMKELGDAFRKRERARIAELKALVDEYRSAKNEERKNELKREIARRVKEDYHKRLHENRRQLEEMKRRAMELERELNKREAQSEAVINARTDALLNGTEEVEFPRKGKNQRP